MIQFKFMMGVDMSKDWFNYAILDKEFNAIKEGKVTNRPDEILAFLSDLLKEGAVARMEDLYLCLEHTGRYVQHLVSFSTGQDHYQKTGKNVTIKIIED